MATWTCEHCGESFKRDRSSSRRIRFCGQPCYHAWRAANNVTTGQFEKGSTPWNKNVKGLHLSPDTEFRKGQVPANKLPVGSETIRADKNGTERAWVKTAEPDVWQLRAVVVWERKHGALPKGKVVHHQDHNSLNDAPENLEALTRAEHIERHREDLAAAKRRKSEDSPLWQAADGAT